MKDFFLFILLIFIIIIIVPLLEWVVEKYFVVVITLTILCILAPAVYFGYKWIENCIKNYKNKAWQKQTKRDIINLLKVIFIPLVFGFGIVGVILLLFYGSYVG